MAQYACFDIGGTAIKYGLADELGNFTHTGHIATEVREKGVAQIIPKIVQQIKAYQRSHIVVGVAIASAGVVNAQTGEIIYGGINFPGYAGTKIKAQVEAVTGLPCTVENDVNAAGLGEYWRGAGQGAQSLFCLMVGTGIGGCFILKGELVRGVSYSAGEIGYLQTDGTGSFEEIASVTALIKRVARAKQLKSSELNGEKVFALAKAGDKEAVQAIEAVIKIWATGIANICYVVNPERVVIGGGIMAQEAYLRPRLKAALQQSMLPLVYTKTTFSFASLANNVGLTGALYYFLQWQKAKDML